MGTKVADVLLNEIDKTILRIFVFSKKKNIRRCVIKKRTLLFYRVTGSEIFNINSC